MSDVPDNASPTRSNSESENPAIDTTTSATDGAVHAVVATSCGSELCGSFTGTAVGFEDIREVNPPLSIDRDFNDIVFGVQQNPATVVPEPMTMTLLATGLAGMSGVGMVRRRKVPRRR